MFAIWALRFEITSDLRFGALSPKLSRSPSVTFRNQTLGHSHCDPSDHLQESPGPPGPKSQTSLEKSLFGGLQKSPPKYPKKSKNTQKIPKFGFFGYFSIFSGIFGYFFADPQKDSFRDFFGISGPEGPETPVNGRLGRNILMS